MFYGRQKELALLEEKYNSQKSELIVVYGRRRVGKSKLLEEFCKKKRVLRFEAIEGEKTSNQIKHFTRTLQKQVQDSALNGTTFNNWDACFSYLNLWIKQSSQRTVICFDELQWMAAGRKALVSLIKYYWDNHWKNGNVVLILCGSVASFMVDHVVRSRALYGRINLELLLQSLKPSEAKLMFRGKRSNEEIIKYLLVFGGIPKYLEEINLNASFEQNIKSLCFNKNGPMVQEFDRIFYNQFKEPSNYLKIVRLLQENLFSLDEVSKKIQFKSGGGLKSYLRHLEDAEFIQSYIPILDSIRSKNKKYKLIDEYLIFYFKYIEPNLKKIQTGMSENLFENQIKSQWTSWFGLAFERMCIKNAQVIAKKLGFADLVVNVGPYFGKGDQRFQIDLLFERSDRVYTLCEIKYFDKLVDTSVIPEVKRKCNLFSLPKGYTLETALISLHGPDHSLKAADYFHHFFQAEEFFQ